MKKNIQKIISVLTLIFILNFLFLGRARAVCPVCTIAVGACLGLSRWLGVDDLISGVWIGGLIVSFIAWTIDWLNKKNIRFMFRKIIIAILFYAIIIAPLYKTGIIGHPYNKFWGIDKLVFGIISGSTVFLISIWFNDFLKKKNQGKVYFPFQKVVIPLVSLAINSLIFWLTVCQK
jgi:hypothetical protein